MSKYVKNMAVKCYRWCTWNVSSNLDINNLFHNHRVDFYVGNCHKWLCSSKGLGFMCVKDIDHKSKNNIEIVPRVISHGYGDGFLAITYGMDVVIIAVFWHYRYY